MDISKLNYNSDVNMAPNIVDVVIYIVYTISIALCHRNIFGHLRKEQNSSI